MDKINKKEELEQFIADGNGKVKVVKLSANWCSPCRVLGSTIESLTLEETDGVEFKEADVDEIEEEVLETYSVRGIPVLLFFKDGLLADKTVGLLTKEALLDKINEVKNK